MRKEIKSLSEQGFYIYPLSSNTKIPLKGSNGFNDATIDITQLESWFGDGSDYNVAINLSLSDLVVIDCDRHEESVDGLANFRDLWLRYDTTPNTYVEQTPNDGLHYFFKLPTGSKINQETHAFKQQLGLDKTGIDIIRYGIPVYPSRTSRGQYKPMHGDLSEIAMIPTWLLNLITEEEQTSFTLSNTRPTSKKYTGAFLDELVRGCPDGEGNDWIMRQVSKMLALGTDLETIYKLIFVVNENFLDKPIEQKEIHATIKSRLKKHNSRNGGVN